MSQVPQAERKAAFLFPGQGSQQVGMGRALYEQFDVARRTFEEADDILGFGLSKLCFEGPAEELTETANTQPAILTTSVAALRALQEVTGSEIRPRFVAGHSLGEYAALVAAETVSFEDALRLVRLRGLLMSEAGSTHPGGMAAVLGLETDVLAQACQQASASGGVVNIANDNAPGQVVISGDASTLERAMDLARRYGARRVIRLAVSIAAHSLLMSDAAEGLRSAIHQTHLSVPRIVVIGNSDASPLDDVDGVRTELVRQLTVLVRWTDTMRYFVHQGVTHFLEIGPGNVLAGLAKRVAGEATVMSLGEPESLALLSQNWTGQLP